MFDDINKDQIILHFQNGNFDYILNNFCKRNKNELIINYLYFKYLGNSNTYELFVKIVLNHIDNILTEYESFNVHVSIKKLNIIEINKHIDFIRNVSNLLKEKYQNQMRKCNVYNASNLFSQIYEIISPFIDKDTQEKIEIHKIYNK